MVENGLTLRSFPTSAGTDLKMYFSESRICSEHKLFQFYFDGDGFNLVGFGIKKKEKLKKCPEIQVLKIKAPNELIYLWSQGQQSKTKIYWKSKIWWKTMFIRELRG